MWRELNWSEGYHAEFITPPVISALLLSDGQSVSQHQAAAATVAGIDKFSLNDAATWRSVHERYHRLIKEHLIPYYYSPPRHTDALLQNLAAEARWQKLPAPVADDTAPSGGRAF